MCHTCVLTTCAFIFDNFVAHNFFFTVCAQYAYFVGLQGTFRVAPPITFISALCTFIRHNLIKHNTRLSHYKSHTSGADLNIANKEISIKYTVLKYEFGYRSRHFSALIVLVAAAYTYRVTCFVFVFAYFRSSAFGGLCFGARALIGNDSWDECICLGVKSFHFHLNESLLIWQTQKLVFKLNT